jgi:large subunit ribosomal protein L22
LGGGGVKKCVGGRSAGIIKPFAHLTIVVRERAEAEDK